jgi:hypothetical protein
MLFTSGLLKHRIVDPIKPVRIPQEFISSSERKQGSTQVSYYATQTCGVLTVDMPCVVGADCDERCDDPDANETKGKAKKDNGDKSACLVVLEVGYKI